eukprot:92157-Amphidinium_carterae.1
MLVTRGRVLQLCPRTKSCLWQYLVSARHSSICMEETPSKHGLWRSGYVQLGTQLGPGSWSKAKVKRVERSGTRFARARQLLPSCMQTQHFALPI